MNTIIVEKEIAYEYKKNKNYYVTKTGKIYSVLVVGGHGKTDIQNPHRLAYGKDKDGCYRVVLSMNGYKRYVKVHTVVAEQFLGDIQDGFVINHKDGIKTNNHIRNLEIVTVKENTIHAHKMQLTSNEYKIDVECDSEIYRFNSLKECMDYFPDLSKHYLRQLRNQEILFSMILFQKKSDSRIAEVDAYYNGKLYKTFKNMKEASIAFNKSKGSVFSAIKKQRI